MSSKKQVLAINSKKTATRKDSHIALALLSQNSLIDARFYYEPMLAAHPNKNDEWPISIGNRKMKYPIWISSMTGGTTKTNEINNRLAIAAAKFGLGMGVGSARIALENKEKINDFNLRPILGNQTPFYLNFGIAQIEKMIAAKSLMQLIN
jgi:isopentenyl-diphosphate delta-isomerase